MEQVNNHQDNCIFCKIISGAIPTNKIYEDKYFIAFNDIKPAMPMHILIIPKQHIDMLSSCNINNENDVLLLGKMLCLAPILAKQEGCRNGFKININTGKEGGQEVFHLHIHVMGNK